ncbi:Nif11-like leader peptide family natural product precursor [Cyanobacterium sp. Dongsha4]|uniref:Nif11-like leader peptide family natural product precursor n=1 Tax=Cyanobacterium sp. DS4 TaxID=2878255 RepID=UPI002E815071|nr:Nif11-like leader peptide family natural product precursor [Cyanobacterium sp. Dongsha4]WVL01347.1 Nif11-like leader peptide family natural product precursor [Cyanobacterium sp. Dongsha4]
MSQKNVSEFFAKVEEDDVLQQRLIQILQSEDLDHREEAVKLANEYGYEVTGEELAQEVQKRQEDFARRQEMGELTDEELEAVAGGGGVDGILKFVFKVGEALVKKSKW